MGNSLSLSISVDYKMGLLALAPCKAIVGHTHEDGNGSSGFGTCKAIVGHTHEDGAVRDNSRYRPSKK